MRLIAFIVPLVSCGAAVAQGYPTVYHHLYWREVDSVTGAPVSNPNGIVEPGESAYISLSASFTPPVGTFVPLPAPWEGMTVHALAGLNTFNLHYSPGSWTNLGYGAGWYGPPGQPSGHIITGIALEQSALGANTGNPVHELWHGVWTPASYSQGASSFHTWHIGAAQTAHSALWISFLNTPQQYEYWLGFALNDSLQIPVIPAPRTGALFLSAFLLAHGRRRRG